jgi:hypothetical protein
MNYDKKLMGGDGGNYSYTQYLRLNVISFSAKGVQKVKVSKVLEMGGFEEKVDYKGLKQQTKKDMEKESLFNLKMDKVNASKKYKAFSEGSKWLSWIVLILGSVIGSKVALIAMTLSMVIQLFHKFILFRKGFGPTLTYFLVATTNMLEEDEEDGISLTPRFKSQRLVSEGEFNSTVLSAFPVDVYLICGFFMLRFIR